MAFDERAFVCADCGKEFKFTPEEQQFFTDKGFKNDPKRCLDCRRNRRQQRRNRTRKPSDGGQGGIFRIVCDACGKQDTVPFPPRADKPVYCNECFAKVKSGELTPAKPYLAPQSDDAPAGDSILVDENAPVDEHAEPQNENDESETPNA